MASLHVSKDCSVSTSVRALCFGTKDLWAIAVMRLPQITQEMRARLPNMTGLILGWQRQIYRYWYDYLESVTTSRYVKISEVSVSTSQCSISSGVLALSGELKVYSLYVDRVFIQLRCVGTDLSHRR